MKNRNKQNHLGKGIEVALLPGRPKLLPSRHWNVAGEKEVQILLLGHAPFWNREGAKCSRNRMMDGVEELTDLLLEFAAECSSGVFFSSRPD